MKTSEIVVAGIVKNVGRTIDLDYLRLRESLSNFEKILWIIVESDSTDDTVHALSNLAASDSNFKFVTLGSLADRIERRTERLAFARNTYLDIINSENRYATCDYVVVSDFNNLNNRLTPKSFNSCFDNSNWSVCCANQAGPYYDIYALRHDLWSPNDCWKQHSFYRSYHRFPEKALQASIKIRMIKIPTDSQWIEVDSAFGGLAIYKKFTLKIGRYAGVDENGDSICEHVPLNLAISKAGHKIMINPQFINFRKTDHSNLVGSIGLFKRISMYPFKVLKKLN